MASATISSLGVGSGLDLQTLYTNLENAENTKLTTITNQQSSYNAQLSAFSKLQSAMQSLNTATAALAKADTWNATSVGSTNNSFTATTTAGASVNNYNIRVLSMAKSQMLTSASQASATAQLGETTGSTRTITIEQTGVNKPLTVELSDSDTSLNGIASAINKANGNITASVVKAKDGDYTLMLTSKTTGTENDMTITVSGDDTLQGIIGYESSTGSGGMTEKVASTNAKVDINGITVERSTNTITDALPGITLSLKSESTSSENLIIDRSTDATQKAITDWATAYNSLQSTITSITKYTKVEAGEDQSANNGALLGDSTVRSVQAQLRGLLTEVQSGSYAILAQLGVTQDPTKGADGTLGNLKVDATKLTKALSDNPEGVQAYFMGDGKTNGLATQMGITLTNMLSTTAGKEGIIKNATDGINTTLKTLSKRYDAMEASIEATMARYKAQFTSLDTLVSKLNNTASYLTQQFSSK
ncbi:flagellar filament capping protein FliD [Enterobacter cloacae]|uniref:flagellar filament capping protein FliD n=1 Tax=Enterobacter cloacae TaxID=550 RepID=UPI000B8D39D1|nr:flagellar filament capping protein FliD [Enterobacter cloacae]ASQ18580.1 Flagellar hook-associated protein 2 [Enterobacter cloacae]MBN4792972.1 flagellar filament capping protein FliD [Enterobacter cloacae]RTO56562.1 flagellar filament capping protein FliD [Enterobacter cloacae]